MWMHCDQLPHSLTVIPSPTMMYTGTLSQQLLTLSILPCQRFLSCQQNYYTKYIMQSQTVGVLSILIIVVVVVNFT